MQFYMIHKKEIDMWKFDSNVADRFQNEAVTNIPDYERVIDLCVDLCSNFPKDAKVVDVGSALGHTMGKFTQAGFTNVWGIDSSKDMNDRNPFKTFVHHSDEFVGGPYDIVLCNWTMHFIKNKEHYLSSIYDNTNDGGILILTDKTEQSDHVKKLYYDFKRANGVSDDYIKHKEEQLKGFMHLWDTFSYLDVMMNLGWYVEVVNARLGFVTFLARKIPV